MFHFLELLHDESYKFPELRTSGVEYFSLITLIVPTDLPCMEASL